MSEEQKFKIEPSDLSGIEREELIIQPESSDLRTLDFDAESLNIDMQEKITAETLDFTNLQESFSFLPLVWETLDLIQRSASVVEISKNATALANKLKDALTLAEQLPGSHLSIDQQQELIQNEIEHITLRREQRLKYLQLPIFSTYSKRPLSSPTSNPKPPVKQISE
ncbi:mediator of RNA polymerase II transcription subunit 9, variant 2 [Entomophthora muscae]|uniref:Mediator of RNA polymerase II transcription subunit 9, variant 2 n=2 Tax=Entomophthora muscae TaxID=34485 RepID=A0ACC2UCD3_9FUNG|nr:mediator of RNA polymerase II transcription subunit 9, variant 2 [Entomophthora muscae]